MEVSSAARIVLLQKPRLWRLGGSVLDQTLNRIYEVAKTAASLIPKKLSGSE